MTAFIPGYLTYTRQGVADIVILEAYYAALEKEYKRGYRDGKRSSPPAPQIFTGEKIGSSR